MADSQARLAAHADGARESIGDTLDRRLRRSRRPRRSRLTRSAVQVLAIRLVILAAFLGLWKLISMRGNMDFYLSNPWAVVQRLGDWASNGTLVSSVRVTLTEAVVGYVIGGVGGAVLGFVLGRLRRVGGLLEPFILSVYSLPKIALAPLFVLWLGIGISTKIAMSAALVIFLVFYSTYNGAKNVDEWLCDQARIMGASQTSVMFKVVAPQIAIWVFAGLRIALPYSLMGAVVGEFVASTEGIGYLINNATTTFDSAGVFAGLFLLMVLALLMNGLVALLERPTRKWRNTGESEQAGNVL